MDTVAVYSAADADALHVQLATQAVCIGPAKAADSYLNVDALLTVARQTGCDALHPGYGFLSENAEFAQRCADLGLTFIGPSGDVIRTMGNKAAARALMQAHGVPVVPGSDGPGGHRPGRPGRGGVHRLPGAGEGQCRRRWPRDAPGGPA